MTYGITVTDNDILHDKQIPDTNKLVSVATLT